jgi:hypothetical protein
MKTHCSNMNHGRINAPVRHCPICGEKINFSLVSKCNNEKHISLRKNRLKFCSDCGVKL